MNLYSESSDCKSHARSLVVIYRVTCLLMSLLSSKVRLQHGPRQNHCEQRFDKTRESKKWNNVLTFSVSIYNSSE